MTETRDIRRVEREYMNIPPPPPAINALVSALVLSYKYGYH